MDGSAKVFWNILKDVPLKEQSAKRKYLKVKQRVEFDDGKGGKIALLPANELAVKFEIDFPSKIVGHQLFDEKVTSEIFASEIAPSRTFCEKYQVDYLRSIGLIKGGSLDNAIVLDGENILNPEGFRLENECVRHKSLDAIGDLYTSGYRILGSFIGFRSGHFHNNEVLKKLFAEKENFEIIEG
jgi:UDP-3-O-[3-hydroxymyristoyl] N-acetylglucosamine deacetylase